MANGLKTDGPEFTRTLCAVLVELDSMRDQCIAEERGLVNARKKLEKDLGKLGEDESPESNRVRVAFTKVIMALKNCRAQIEHLNDQICRGLKFGQQPMLIQAEQEGRIRELIASKEDAQHSLELWKSTSAESRKVGSQTGEGEEGPVGEPDGDEDEEGDAADAEQEGAEAETAQESPSGFPTNCRVRITRKRDGAEIVKDGTLEYHSVKHGYATVYAGGVRARHELEQDKLVMERIPDAAPASVGTGVPNAGARVNVLHKVTGEHRGEGTLERITDDYAIANIGGKSKRFELDIYSVTEAVPAGVAAMVKGEIHETKPAAEKPAKKKKPARA